MSDNRDAIARDIAAAYRDPTKRISAARLTGLERADAMAIQGGVQTLLNETVPVAKVALGKDGVGLAAPIFSALVRDSGAEIVLGERDFVGLEIEVAARLQADITPDLAKAGPEAVLGAIEYFTLGIELIGSRIDDRTAAGPFGPLADNMVSGGYVRRADALRHMPIVDGLPVTMLCDGSVVQSEVAKHPFGDPVKPILAYALAADDRFGGLRRGMLVTTGSLSPLLIPQGRGRIEIKLGDLPSVSVVLR
ncbi:hypothetical protein ACFSM5_08230 [Lacibacterium aquatile]|uniref:2-keto-4-pentenoate hydratase n=1 Tax=Lacibacterium aquatile TaxID=1168082 RepID=A0ABW5DPD0_9PROT